MSSSKNDYVYKHIFSQARKRAQEISFRAALPRDCTSLFSGVFSPSMHIVPRFIRASSKPFRRFLYVPNIKTGEEKGRLSLCDSAQIVVTQRIAVQRATP
ncbi:hypothetical protein [Nitratireductor rhodophyticola]|uniref:hypothetical protein n=1 Tax=Nitratireductor rhodophyticola TaxID=2854036 RepID=UPI003BA9A4F4